ncbi:hypothetical protein NVV95_01810 [Herbiconiux sp. CPCC 205716]|uniref:Uncharacterized protein n=1 Tax=Herbiconiux gentiana TaxID=2970912 RepID=A0ABT2GCC5_9MICO|nr:hypothetical protein [Herbiconiux gentiana]MCS5713282.1 hypothetical protein [Herbiconiux gentiana]
MRRVRSVLVAVVVIGLLSACIGSPPTPRASDADADAGASGIALTRDQLEDAGLALVDDETVAVEASAALTLTAIQAERMITEASLGAGVSGAELDALVPAEPGYPSASYLLAAWISSAELPGEHPGAELVRPLYDDPEGIDWTHPQSIVFPMVVVALFVQDFLTAAAEDGSFGEEATTPGASAGERGPASAVTAALQRAPAPAAVTAGVLDAPCSTLTGFLSSAVQKVFDVLRVVPQAISGIEELGPFGLLAGAVIGGAIDLAQGVVSGLISSVTAPALNVLRVALTGLGVASEVLSFFTGQRLTVTAAPADHTAFAIDPAADVTGTFRAEANKLSDDWPKALVDCATASGAEIPPLIRAGDPADWTLTSGDGLIVLDSASSRVADDRSVSMGFTTGREDAETAKGPEITRIARVSVTVPRQEVGEFLDFAARQVETLKGEILAKLPGLLQEPAATVLNAVIDPIVATIRAEVTEVTGGIGMLNLAGDGFVWVTYHEPKQPDPAPSADPEPLPEEEGDFCTQFSEQAGIAAAALPGAADPFSWAAAFAAGLHGITATPPADLAADFSTVLAFYDLAGTISFENAQPLADFVAANDIDGARVRLWTACGAPQIDGGL